MDVLAIIPSVSFIYIQITSRTGAGTGIFTRALLNQKWSSEIKHIKAVEPSQGMREVFAKTVSSDHVSISLGEGTFDTTGVEDQWGDIVVIAQVASRLYTHAH